MRVFADVAVLLDGVSYSRATIEIQVPSDQTIPLDPFGLGQALRGVPLEHLHSSRLQLQVRLRFDG